MLKPITAAALGLALMGCAQMEARGAMSYGMLRVDPHPIHADSVRVIMAVQWIPLDTLARSTPEGPRNVVNALFGDKCKDAPIIEEGRIKLAAGREDAVLRVVCPEARE